MDQSPDIEQELWDKHVAWSLVADRLKRSRTTARTTALFLTIIGAALQTIAGTSKAIQWGTIAGILGTVALALVPLIATFWLKPEQTKRWLRARSISEGIKSEYHLFRAQAAPYDADGALQRLDSKITEIDSWGADMENLRAAIGSPGETPPGITPATYVKDRIYEQINRFYEPKAKLNAQLAQRFRMIEIALTFVTAALSVLANMKHDPVSGVAAPFAAWIAVLTTVGGTIAAFAAAGRYEFQATTYFATAANLKDLVRGWKLKDCPGPPSQDWSTFVKNCEATISAENRGWMAKLDDAQQSVTTQESSSPRPPSQ